jgi:hypothetical protein
VAVVLCTGVDPALTKTRKLILETVGHTVFTTTDEREIASLCSQYRFDVAVLGQARSAQVKRQIASVVRQHCPSAKILELYLIHQGKAIPDADSWMENPPETPLQLVEHVAQLAGEGKGKSANP